MQEKLFHGEHLPLRWAYQQLFRHLPQLATEPATGRGRPTINRDALLPALIYRALRRFASLTDLVRALQENPAVLEALGRDPLAAVPPVERFSDWLRETDNAQLRGVRLSLLRCLFAAGVFSGRVLALDSCPVLSPVRENNLKTAVAERFNKLRYPHADPTARLGVLASYARPESRKVIFFWGYRNHAVVDTETALPLWERTAPADRKESTIAIPVLQELTTAVPLPIKAACADCSYATETFLRFIVETLHAQPVVAAHPRLQSNPAFRVQGPVVICPAKLEMFRRGKMTPRRTGIT